MDIGVPSPQAILIISFNIFRVLCRRYGLYFVFGVIILVFQGFSGYYLYFYGIDHNTIDKPKPLLSYGSGSEDFDKSFWKRNYVWNVQDSKGDIISIGLSDYKKLQKDEIGSKSENEIFPHISNTHNKGPSKGESIPIKENNFGITLPCEITNKEVLSALKRSKTLECKKEIANISCEVEKGTFYPSRLVSFCPTYGRIRGRNLGCYEDNVNDRIFKDFVVTLRKNSPSICADLCFQRGFVLSGVQYAKECFCGNEELPPKLRVSDKECDMPCVGTQDSDLRCGGYLRMNIIETGLAKLTPKPLRKPATNSSSPGVRIAFILTVNGRSLRQIFRLFKALFHRDHYFFIHVDSRQHYLFRELQQLEKTFSNVLLSRTRFSSIWGGSSLLKVLLHCMEELLMKSDWNWDFVINLSESDFPIKTNMALVDFLTANKERNFLKSHGHDTNKFLKKQGLDRTFLECETHMWRIGQRKLPLGIRIDGGSDWVCLNRQFVEYITIGNDVLVNGLKKVFSYTLLPGESFFHTVLRNSEYCQTFTDNNLHVTNWKRKLGCRCQYKHIVDWCGCSPNDFTPSDWAKLEASKNRNLFFGRKFEAVKSLEAINKVDEWLYGKYDPNTPSLESFWENIYHFDDPPNPKDDVAVTLFNSVMRLAVRKLTGPGEQASTETTVCDASPVIPTQVHSFHVRDQFQGLIVEFLARSKSGGELKLETFIQPQNSLLISDSSLSSKLTKMEINTNIDLKEQMFRNFGGHLGPQDQITVALWLKTSPTTNPGSEDDQNGFGEDQDSMTVEVVLVDSVNAIAERIELILNEDEEVMTHTFTLSGPLRPGIWKAYLIHKHQIVATLRFPILPLQFLHGRLISLADSMRLHGGPKMPYSDIAEDTLELFRDWKNIADMPFLFPGNETLLKSANEKALYSLPRVSKWIDQVVSESYRILGICYLSAQEIPPCLKRNTPPCSSTAWSSHSPDPKSQLGPIDPRTGRLVEPFRVTEGS